MQTPINFSHRSTMMCKNGLVASEHPLASMAGIKILESGGNAIDASIAVNSVLNVVEPSHCGIGGDVFYLIYFDDKIYCLNGSGKSSCNASIDLYKNYELSQIPETGPLSAITVPGCVQGWKTVLDKFGTKTPDILLESAINYAKYGFPISHKLNDSIFRYKTIFQKNTLWNNTFINNSPPYPGSLLFQKDLANTFQSLIDNGFDDFYYGGIAKQISRYLEKNSGLINSTDLENHVSQWQEPIKTNYKEYQIYETAPNSQGLTALISLNILENFDFSSLKYLSSEHLHLLIESNKLAYTIRDSYIADPEFINIPISKIVSKNFANKLKQNINLNSVYSPPVNNLSSNIKKPGDTTYFAIVDKNRNCVSCVQSLYSSFGSGTIVENTGILLHNRGSYFTLLPKHHNSLEPNKRTFHTLTASLTFSDGHPFLIFGSMGGDVQPQIHLQIFSSIFDFNMDIQNAIEAPRWSMPKSIYSNDHSLLFEQRFPTNTINKLKDIGHHITFTPPYYSPSGHAHGIIIQNNILMGGADPRGDGIALGY